MTRVNLMYVKAQPLQTCVEFFWLNQYNTDVYKILKCKWKTR